MTPSWHAQKSWGIVTALSEQRGWWCGGVPGYPKTSLVSQSYSVGPKLPPLREKFDLRLYPRWLRPGITLHPGAYYGVPNCSSMGCTPFPSVCPLGLLGVCA